MYIAELESEIPSLSQTFRHISTSLLESSSNNLQGSLKGRLLLEDFKAGHYCAMHKLMRALHHHLYPAYEILCADFCPTFDQPHIVEVAYFTTAHS